MATRYGKPCSIEDEIIYCFSGFPAGELMTRWHLRDWVLEVRYVQCSEEELDAAIRAIEASYGVTFPEGSFEEAPIYDMSADDLRRELEVRNRYCPALVSKLDELEYLRAQRRFN